MLAAGNQRMNVNDRWSLVGGAVGLLAAFVLATHLILLTSVVLRVLVAVGVIAALRTIPLREFAVTTATILLALVAWFSYLDAAGGRPGNGSRVVAVAVLAVLMPLIGLQRADRVMVITRAHPATAIAVAVLAIELHPISDVTIISGGSQLAVLSALLVAPLLTVATARWGRVREGISVAEPLLVAILVWLIIQPHIVIADLRWPMLKDHYIPLVVPCSIAAAMVLILFEYAPLFIKQAKSARRRRA
jgi:hypothetical protein